MSETLFGTTVPGTIDSGDSSAYEMGTVFSAAVAGNVTGVRFYKSTNNGGTHTGHLWTISGTLLGSIGFTGESASGWQEMDFTSPLPISANTQYVISVSVPNGHYSDNSNFFTTNSYSNGQNLTAPRANLTTHGNGVFNTSPGQFPTTDFNDTNYWVDLVFAVVSGIVPNVVNSPLLNAEQALVNAGYYANPITNAYSATVASGNVISQNPIGGTSLAQGNSVALVVSLGAHPVFRITTVLAALQAAALNILTGDAFFNGLASTNAQAVPIITEQKASITQEIELALNQVGICALIMTPTFEFHQPKGQDLSGWASLIIAIYENATVNSNSAQGTNIPAVSLAERVVAIMHWAQHGVPTAPTAQEITAATRFLSAPKTIELASNGPPLQYNVMFQAHVTLNPLYNPS